MYEELIDYFHRGIKTDNTMKSVDFAKLNEKAVLLGYIIHPDCCNEHVEAWLENLTYNYNATFYKEWNDIISKNRFELFEDQILHYATTYGTDFSIGNGYVQNDGATVPCFKNLKVIKPISEYELFNKCMDVLKSGIALKSSTSDVLVNFVYHFMKKCCFDVDSMIGVLTSIKNKEAQTILSLKCELMPNDEFGLLRCLVYRYTESPLLIKSADVISRIKLAAKHFGEKSPLLKLTDGQINLLSKIFYRFKPLILAMKVKSTAHVVNRIRRLAKKNHIPFHIGFWENIISNKKPIVEVCERLKELDNFRKIRLLMLVKERIMFETNIGVFPIRNGKLYVREGYYPSYDVGWLVTLFLTIKASLVNSLAKKACKVKFPSGINLVLPSSEKTFVGNFPFGSYFDMTKNNAVGIYWRNEWGTHDFDISMSDLSGHLISWYADYSNENSSVIYSGDMTNADPEAVEMLYFKNSSPDGIVMLNKYRGNDDSKFRFFYANEIPDAKSIEHHMVDPNNVRFDTMIDFNGQGQKTIGVICDNKFVFMDFTTGKNKVSSSGKYVGIVVESMKQKIRSFINLKDILLEAGYVEVEDGETPYIDFSNLEKDTLISLISKEN